MALTIMDLKKAVIARDVAIAELREANRRLQLRLVASGCASLAHAYQAVSDENVRLRQALGLAA